mmetsp:Transcript_45430/g.83093  ORF Transcript_45430/g.83093 Transcript_45430/m.83093 type:complete len:469 (+) Transcript_45430:129-1535(+)
MIPLCQALCRGKEKGSNCTPSPPAESLPVIWLEGEAAAWQASEPNRAPSLQEAGVVTYATGLEFPILGPPVRVGEVWHLAPGPGRSFDRAMLFLHMNGFIIRTPSDEDVLSISWSPFSLVQSCRLNSIVDDERAPLLRLFRVSVYAHSWSHVFAVQGEDADASRARWVADMARVLRVLTQSLFPPFSLCVDPLPEARWTSTRLLAGYMLLCEEAGVLLVYCELHAHKDNGALFSAYVDERCMTQIFSVNIKVHTSVSEVVGIDCSCFSIDGKHFSTRSCAEKLLWLRAMSNLKVKLQHHAANPSPGDLMHYRLSIQEFVETLSQPDVGVSWTALLEKEQVRGNGYTAPSQPAPATPRSMLAEGQVPLANAQADQPPCIAEDVGKDDVDWVETVPVGPTNGHHTDKEAAARKLLEAADGIDSREDTIALDDFPLGAPCQETTKLSGQVPVPMSVARATATVQPGTHTHL